MSYLDLDFSNSMSARLMFKKYTQRSAYSVWIQYRERELRLKVLHWLTK